MPRRPRSSSPRKLWIILLGVFLLVVIVITVIVAVLLLNRKLKVSIADYVTIQVTGANGYATASYEFDTEKFREDFSGKLKFSESASSIMMLYGDDAVQYFIDFYQSGTLNKTSEISNGDIIVWTSDLEQYSSSTYYEAEEFFERCELTGFTTELKVEDLGDAAQVNPLDCASVTFSGVAPNGTAELHTDATTSTEIDETLRNAITVSPDSGLSNGDTVTISFEKTMSDSDYAEQYGYVPIEEERQVTVEGLSAYVTTESEISEDVLAQMKSKAETEIDSNTSKLLVTSANNVTGCSYVGNYFLLAKDMDREDPVNQLTLVYRIDYIDTLSSIGVAKHICMGVSFSDLITQADGTDGSNLTVSSINTVNTLDDMYQICVKEYENEYTCEDYVSGTEAAIAETSENASESASLIASESSAAITETNQVLLYFIEHADSEYFDESYFTGFDKETCRFARNGVYARMGRMFEDATLTAYFSQFDWYQPTIAADDFKESSLNKYQKKNLDVIVTYEKKMGYR